MKPFVSATLLAALSFFTLGCGTGGSPGGGSAARRLNGGGASFVYPLMTKWTSVYDKEKGIKINYQSTGSGAGIKQMTEQTMDFGCTDAPMTDEQLKAANEKGGDVVHIPLVMGGVVPVYNLPGVEKPVKFTGPLLADIYLGKIKKWNDPALKAINPDVEFPDQDIVVVHRADGSGTTYIFVEYLSKVSPEWKSKVGVSTSVDWPIGVGQKGNEGVAGQVTRTAGSIGYVELIYALQNKIKYGSVQNSAGEFVSASLESVSAAAKNALTTIPESLRYSLTDAPGKDSYPISGTDWAVIYKNLPAGVAEEVAGFFRWVLHEGQNYTEELHYARLPEDLVRLADKKLDEIKPAH
jgi:phosphate transport system substrate-binding protein